MLCHASGDSANASALPSLRSSFIASLQSLASSDVSFGSLRLVLLYAGVSAQKFQETDLPRADVLQAVNIRRRSCPLRNLPKSQLAYRRIPVNDSSGSSLYELGGIFSSPCERKYSPKKAMFLSRMKLWSNSDILLAKPLTNNDVLNFIMISSSGDSHFQHREEGYWNCELPWMVLVVMMNLENLSPYSFHCKP
ncbi:hypothetical protein RB195_011311 [Necator americanus]|uniref:Uncharacterized protein n=1 Tax=Necator americanus TaxID=51031 RepID=A0ABR1D1U8_NECAM